MGVTLVFCSRCGTKNNDNARYCVNCNEPLRIQTRNLDKELSDLSWKLRRTISSSKLKDYRWLNRIMAKNAPDDLARVERYKYLIERVEYSVKNPTTPTGLVELDDILYGGIPLGYSILLTSPPLDEKDQITEAFLQEGVNQGETVLLISTMLKEVSSRFVLNNQENFFLVLVSPWADNVIQDLPNVLKFHGMEDLTQLNISLKVFLRDITGDGRNIDRVVIEPLSDALLMHETRVVRRWLMDLLMMFKQMNATTLSNLDPGMHSTGESRIIIDLFDGHLDLTEKRVGDASKKILNVRRLYNKKYLKRDLEMHTH